MRHKSRCNSCREAWEEEEKKREEEEKKEQEEEGKDEVRRTVGLPSHDPNKERCEDHHKFKRRLRAIRDLTWKLSREQWERIEAPKDLRMVMMRLFKTS